MSMSVAVHELKSVRSYREDFCCSLFFPLFIFQSVNTYLVKIYLLQNTGVRINEFGLEVNIEKAKCISMSSAECGESSDSEDK